MSFYNQPDDMSMESILQPLIDGGSFVKLQNEAGGFIEDFGGFILSIWVME